VLVCEAERWPSAAIAVPLLARVKSQASPAQLRAAIEYVLRWDTPFVRLRTVSEAADQLAFRLGLQPTRAVSGVLRDLLAHTPAPVPLEGAEEALRAVRACGTRVAILSDWPPYLPLGPARRLTRLADAHASEAEGIPLGTREFYASLLTRQNRRPEETLVIGADPVTSVRVLSRMRIRSIVVLPEPAGAPPRCGQLATVRSVGEAAAFVVEHLCSARGFGVAGPQPNETGGAGSDGDQQAHDEEAVPPGDGSDGDDGVGGPDDHPGERARAGREAGAE
jgi:hypothetical protein